MIPKRDLTHALALLETDLLPHVVTLKMLHNYSGSMRIRLAEGEEGWALYSYLPIAVSEWDRKAYPTADAVVFLDGPNMKAKLALLSELPEGTLVLKTGDENLKQRLDVSPITRKATEYRSFTTEAAVSNVRLGPGILHSSQLDEPVSTLIERNGYEPQELRRYFSGGAEWFGIREQGRFTSVCFVHQNYAKVWEIAGVYTEPECRGRGLARKTVAAALVYLRSQDLIPRYQVRWDNAASISLAKSSGLVEFLRVNHYLIVQGSQ